MSEHAVIALSGKGGVGKSTVAALLIKVLRDRDNGAVFAVDADPNSCLADYLGLEVEEDIGSIREETLHSISEIPSGMTKERWINYRIQECLVESTEIDLLVMGRPEGPGCYCYLNNLIRAYVDSMHRNYRYIVIDNEAGMEHLSRRSSRTIDHLLIVSDFTLHGLKAASRIYDISRKLDLVTHHTGLVLNLADDSKTESENNFIEEIGLDIIGRLPTDPFLKKFGLTGDTLLEIPDDNPVVRAVRELSIVLDL